ncbi:MAG TPA: RNA polymerase factor sigma-54 [Terriglobales bacterium]|jgi:RNA polymerase sigma-54 factor|nr:RNA polymerase factor sigma-54 [Terriglobales bacterium]
MALLQPKLNLKVSQKQILTPGLVQMVSVLALNKLELADMINAELTENPVLEELDNSVPLLDEISAREEQKERDSSLATQEQPAETKQEKDPFEEIDFGSFFSEYLDPGLRTPIEMEDSEKPSFENFLSKPSTLTDHLMWQLGSLHVNEDVYRAAELVIGNLNEEGYLIATDDELLGLAEEEMAAADLRPVVEAVIGQQPIEHDAGTPVEMGLTGAAAPELAGIVSPEASELAVAVAEAVAEEESALPELQRAEVQEQSAEPELPRPKLVPPRTSPPRVPFSRDALREAIDLVKQMDPVGVGARDLRECLLAQLHDLKRVPRKNGNGTHQAELEALDDAIILVDQHLHALQNKHYKEVAKAMGRPVEAVMQAMDFIRTLDPRPGLRYNKVETRLIEPDVAFVKQGEEFIVLMNDEEVPQLRLNPSYRRLLSRDAAEKDVRNYVKERYKSAIQLIKNIEQRKQTILRVCYSILERQRDFLDHGIDQLKPMMIKEVAEEIGVHPSTVSRAVANKYAHTPQGVFELRYFFSESVNGPEGSTTSLLILKRRVKKLIEEEDPTRPLTDEQITRILQSQGIQVTRRTVAKYREDMRIPSTHQRRVKS